MFDVNGIKFEIQFHYLFICCNEKGRVERNVYSHESRETKKSGYVSNQN